MNTRARCEVHWEAAAGVWVRWSSTRSKRLQTRCTPRHIEDGIEGTRERCCQKTPVRGIPLEGARLASASTGPQDQGPQATASSVPRIQRRTERADVHLHRAQGSGTMLTAAALALLSLG